MNLKKDRATLISATQWSRKTEWMCVVVLRLHWAAEIMPKTPVESKNAHPLEKLLENKSLVAHVPGLPVPLPSPCLCVFLCFM
jgi:hypothetical protein